MVAKRDSRILLLGCGAVGTVAARHLAASKLVGSLTAADVSADRAKATVAATRSKKVRPLALDLEDDGALRDAVRGTSLVINAALPKYNLAIMAAALEADVDYMDLAGGGKDQLALDPTWKRAGRTAPSGWARTPASGTCSPATPRTGWTRSTP
ncbi:MAG: saccharopine dehydrogenase NADP-binding domain-containing protein [Candidatus Thermoplasmatota archaeon]|mgnify:CR=1 FL=1